MTTLRQTRRLPYPVWPKPQGWRPLLVAALLTAIVIATILMATTTGIVAVMLIRNAVAPAPIAAPVVAAPVPQPKVATAVQPVVAPSPLRVEWQKLCLPEGGGVIPKVIDDEIFIAAGREGSLEPELLFKSVDGGKSWELLPDGPKTLFQKELSTEKATFGSIKRVADVAARFTRGQSPLDWTFQISADDGKTWQNVPVPVQNYLPEDRFFTLFEKNGVVKIFWGDWQATITKSPTP